MFSERVGLQGLREINNLRANVLSEFIKNHVMPKELAINRGYSLQAGSHLGAHARAAKSEFKSEAILREESGDEA